MIHEPECKYLSIRNESSMVAFQHLRYAVISAEYGSFRRAAEALLMRQSTLSRRIRQLEESIGVTVFERSSGGVCATTAGRDFLRTARSILEQMDALVTCAHYTAAERRPAGCGFLYVAIGRQLAGDVGGLPAAVPAVELRMVESSRMRLVTALRNGAIDIVIAPDAGPSLNQGLAALERANFGGPAGGSSARSKK